MQPEIRRLSPACGAEMVGIDLNAELDLDTVHMVKQAWNDAHGVLVLRGQAIAPDRQLAFARHFGQVSGETMGPSGASTGNFSKTRAKHAHPDFPAVMRMSNMKDADGNALGREDAGIYWHTDHSTSRQAARYSMLHALTIPPYGGDTMFADMYLAYERLSSPLQHMLGGLSAVHSLAKRYPEMTVEERQAKSVAHPVVRTIPDTGRKALYVNRGFTTHIEGLPPEESEALLAFLFTHSERPEFVYRHRYQPNDLVMWDNWCTIHCGVPDYKSFGGQRYMHRVTIK